MRYLLLTFALLAVLVVAFAGLRGCRFRQPPLEIYADMKRQPRLRPETASAAFTNGLSSQLIPPGAVAQIKPFQLGEKEIFPWQQVPLNTGRVAGETNFVPTNPLPITATRLAQGRKLFDIHCAACHTRIGDGSSVAKRTGTMAVVANLHEKRIVVMPDGELFNTVTFGKNLMPANADKLDAPERWAVIAYLRALQLSRLATVEDLSEAPRAALPK
jgi:cytochrome c5